MTKPTVVAFVPDLMDRSRISSALPEVRFVPAVGDLAGADADAVVLIDLGRPGALDVIPTLGGRRVVGFASHVERELIDAAKAAGCDQVLPRSAFFSRLAELAG